MQQDLAQAIAKLKPDLSMMEIMGIRVMANRGFLLTRQFMTKNETIELVASEDQLKQFNIGKIYTMTPKELMGSVNFFCTGVSESLDKLQNIDKLLKFAEVTSKIPAMQAIINYQAIGKRIALWLGFEDVDNFINFTAPMLPMSQKNSGMLVPPRPMLSRWAIPPGGNGRGLPPELLTLIAQRMRQPQPNMMGGF
jgi:hypothetical protein